MFRSEPIEDRDDLGAREIGHRDGLVERTGIGVEAAPVDVDQNPVLLIRRYAVDRSHYPNRYPGNGRRCDIHWIHGAVCLGSSCCRGIVSVRLCSRV